MPEICVKQNALPEVALDLSNLVLAFKLAEKPSILNNRTDAYNNLFKPSSSKVCSPADHTASKNVHSPQVIVAHFTTCC